MSDTVAIEANILREASASVTELLSQLRREADHARQRREECSAEARQLELALDELQLQRTFAEQLATPLLEQLRRREAELRQRYAVLVKEAAAVGDAQKRLEQLVRQIEMSSTILSGQVESEQTDPWLLALRAQIIQGREEERARLAREVHDGTAQVVANILMGLEHALRLRAEGSPELEPFLIQLRTAAKEGLQEVRSFIADLRPGVVTERGVRAAIGEYIQTFQETTGIAVSLDLSEWPSALPQEVEIVLYRIVQEALQNIKKHARQANVLIRSLYRQQILTLTIRDDGPGFDPREVARRAGRESWGLTSMRERAALVGGHFSIASRPGFGCEITIRIPVQE